MKASLTPAQTRQLRLQAQALNQRAEASPGETARYMVGVQAQDGMAARLALWARARDLRDAQVTDALEGSRTLVRTWSLRGTLHLHAAEDLGWLLPLVSPVVIRGSRRRSAELGLSEDVYLRARHALEAVLAAAGPLTRAAVAARLAGRGLPTAGQAAYHLLRRAGLEGLVCFGPEVDREPTFVLLEDWVQVDDPPDETAALVRLAHRYLAAYGPARLEDFAAWSGLTRPAASQGFNGLGGRLEPVSIDGEKAWLLKEHAGRLDEGRSQGPLVRLVAGYDPFLSDK